MIKYEKSATLFGEGRISVRWFDTKSNKCQNVSTPEKEILIKFQNPMHTVLSYNDGGRYEGVSLDSALFKKKTPCFATLDEVTRNLKIGFSV